MTSPRQPRLVSTDLACRRGDRVLFRGLTLELEPGAALHVTGANGIGKSSLLRILGGLLAPFAGTVDRKGTVGLVDERPALDPDRPLGKSLDFWAQVDGIGDKMFERYCERLDLDNLLDVPVRFLSTGQKKRAALARLMIQGPDIWLLDEPLSGLDTASQTIVNEVVREQCGYGGIALIASHQPLDIGGLRTLAIADFAA